VFRNTAHVYDLIYEASGKDYAAESAEIQALIGRHNPGARTLLDVACGTGGHLRHLRQWYESTGVDIDADMIAEARLRVPEATLVESDMRAFELETTFDAAVCLFSSIGYMRDGAELDAALSTMARHLAPGGVLVVDGWVRPDAWRDGGVTHVEVAEGDGMKVVRVSRSQREGSATSLEMHHLIATSEGIDHVVDHHELTLFSPEQYEHAFAAAGLTVHTIDGPMPDRDRYVGLKAI
jgi:SAM-dependent methyltransferase